VSSTKSGELPKKTSVAFGGLVRALCAAPAVLTATAGSRKTSAYRAAVGVVSRRPGARVREIRTCS
jgi:hypothetical protein